MISTHVLDTSVGNPAANIPVTLEKRVEGDWKKLGKGATNGDGRIAFDCPSEEGVYRLLFETEDYVSSQNKEHFFLKTPVIFEIKDTNRKYHVPLLLNPYGYSTYRGS